MPQRLRVFISSPTDVSTERRRAALVVEKLAKDYARFFDIEFILWETEPMLASGHFQDNVIPPSEADILILIVWSRLGTALPQKTDLREYRGIDGRVPVTGTEWEFEDALRARQQKGRPRPSRLQERYPAQGRIQLRSRSSGARTANAVARSILEFGTSSIAAKLLRHLAGLPSWTSSSKSSSVTCGA